MQKVTHATHKNSRKWVLRDFEKVACALTQLTQHPIGVRELREGRSGRIGNELRIGRKLQKGMK
jgi:hypothetical protein